MTKRVDSERSNQEFERIEREHARLMIKDFITRRGESALDLLLHAAVPEILTPELLTFIHQHFAPNTPWVTYVDILLDQTICRERGYESYRLVKAVRQELLEQGEVIVDGKTKVNRDKVAEMIKPLEKNII